MKSSTIPDEWPCSCVVCGGWCRPVSELPATTDPLEGSRLVIEAFKHSLGKRAEDDPEGITE